MNQLMRKCLKEKDMEDDRKKARYVTSRHCVVKLLLNQVIKKLTGKEKQRQ